MSSLLKTIAANPIYKALFVVLGAALCGVLDQALMQYLTLPSTSALPVAGLIGAILHNFLSKERDSLLTMGDPTMIHKITGLDLTPPPLDPNFSGPASVPASKIQL